MITDKEYNSLLNMYHRSIAEVKDLREQLSEKEKAWEIAKKATKTTEKHIRELCEDILAKERMEMRLGEEYSWSMVAVDELIQSAKKAFQAYNEKRTSIMMKLLDEMEERREEVESLEMQLERVMRSRNLSAEEIEKEQEEEKKAASREVAAKKIANKQVRDALLDGQIEAIITEDSDDISELDLVNQLIEESGQVTPMANSVPVTPQKEVVQAVKKKRTAMKKKLYRINLSDYEKKMNAISWSVLELIGKEGMSTHNPIEERLITDHKGDLTKGRIRMTIRGLISMGILEDEKVNSPLKPKMMVYSLTDMGATLFEEKYGKSPVLSEAEKIIAEHDNLIHGYGIKTLADLIRSFGIYDEVCDFNRPNPIVLHDGNTYIPDLICRKKDKKDYFEYERGHHTQTDFNRKCNKMAKVSRFLNFIVPNKEALEKIMKQVEGWVTSRGINTLKNIRVRITTVPAIKHLEGTEHLSFRNDKSWQIVYDFNHGKEPVRKI